MLAAALACLALLALPAGSAPQGEDPGTTVRSAASVEAEFDALRAEYEEVLAGLHVMVLQIFDAEVDGARSTKQRGVAEGRRSAFLASGRVPSTDAFLALKREIAAARERLLDSLSATLQRVRGFHGAADVAESLERELAALVRETVEVPPWRTIEVVRREGGPAAEAGGSGHDFRLDAVKAQRISFACSGAVDGVAILRLPLSDETLELALPLAGGTSGERRRIQVALHSGSATIESGAPRASAAGAKRTDGDELPSLELPPGWALSHVKVQEIRFERDSSMPPGVEASDARRTRGSANTSALLVAGSRWNGDTGAWTVTARDGNRATLERPWRSDTADARLVVDVRIDGSAIVVGAVRIVDGGGEIARVHEATGSGLLREGRLTLDLRFRYESADSPGRQRIWIRRYTARRD